MNFKDWWDENFMKDGEDIVVDNYGKAVLDGWQPIETAPRDGTEILVYTDRPKFFIVIPEFEGDDPQQYTWKERAGSYNICATHWMPLPSPPKE